MTNSAILASQPMDSAEGLDALRSQYFDSSRSLNFVFSGEKWRAKNTEYPECDHLS